ncbi:peptide-methionine (S)-S-oxide reductase MsrA [Dokdonella koreensis]|uniref:Peptide methionine sulfoxide reductase MsrA n=1 Tax=Dokdonella koreensis DS-123 TaxID=1300342 RepID=A0A160DXP4_9GAMM|nr:peptide-methionine (S)-S-oxide reductase MsrA [Dokdonella koreensis]ANB19509.1 Peptide methionine sulfoxide reductase MsrA [Dokdonella koreensis DS-123]
MALVCDIPGLNLAVPRGAFPDPARDIDPASISGPQNAVLAAGCFWCAEAVFRELDGVLDVVNGYSGDSAATADYKTVCAGQTNHAEVVSIDYDPARISYGQLLKVFFSVAHDPTQKDRQGNDIGRQYRSAVFYADAAQKEVAESYIAQLSAAGVYSEPIVTDVVPLEAFHRGEQYHQNYAALHPEQPYIAAVAIPKVVKVRKQFADRLKKEPS